MLKNAVRQYEHHCATTGAYKDRFLVVDGDRAEQGDWPIEKLRREAAHFKITVCVQRPKLEGLLLRMLPGMEREIPDVASTETRLKSLWPSYQKPMNANELGRKFSLNDLLRVAGVDSDLETLLKSIGLMGKL
jgi:hypothetical protein